MQDRRVNIQLILVALVRQQVVAICDHLPRAAQLASVVLDDFLCEGALLCDGRDEGFWC